LFNSSPEASSSDDLELENLLSVEAATYMVRQTAVWLWSSVWDAACRSRLIIVTSLYDFHEEQLQKLGNRRPGFVAKLRSQICGVKLC
jgi:hypothetical protein